MASGVKSVHLSNFCEIILMFIQILGHRTNDTPAMPDSGITVFIESQ